MDAQFDPNDGGYSSRKLHLAYFTMFAIFGSAVLAANWPPFAPLFPTLIGGLLAGAGIYNVSNVSSQWVTSKHIQGMATIAADPTPAPAVVVVEKPAMDEKHGFIDPKQEIEAG